MSVNHYVGPNKLRDLRVLSRRGATFEYVQEVFGWSSERLAGVCRKNRLQFTGGPTQIEIDDQKEAARWSARDSDVVTLRLRLPRALFERLLAEAEAIEVRPGACIQKILDCVFASGDLSSLRSADQSGEG